MNKLKEFFELVGIQPNSDFRLKSFGEGLDLKYLYSFKDNGNLERSTGLSFPEYIPRILKGELEIVSEPFKPRVGQEYYYISTLGAIAHTSYLPTGYLFDLGNYFIGNCFPTKTISDDDYQHIKEKFAEAGVDVSEWKL